MEILNFEKHSKINNNISRTIRINGLTFDKILSLAEKNEISFNCVVNQIIEYGLKSLDKD